MRKIVFIFAMLSVSVFANTQKIGANYSLKFETGQRVDNFDWNIGNANYLHTDGNTYRPDILSELIWSDVETYYGKITLYGEEGPYRLKLSYAKTTDASDGENQDSDYLYSGRQGEFSRSNNSAKGSYFEDFSIALGDSYKISNNQNLVIWIGYEQNRQYFRMQNGNQTIPNTGAFAGLDSTYDTKWEGGKIGLEYQIGFSDFKINTSAYYHLMRYEAKANWNLRADFAHPTSFKHELDKATGVTAAFTLDYQLSSNTVLSLNYNYKRYEGENGTNIQYYSNGTQGGSNLNAINWESQHIGLGLEYKF